MNRKNIILAAAAAFVIGLVLGAVAYFFVIFGFYDVAATSEHTSLVRWTMHETMENSVRRRAREVPPPPNYDSTMVRHGFEHFHAMCVECHGAPGIDPGETGKGLNPKAPDLAFEVEEWNDRELFWITKHGVRMTGMPAFGPTHTDADIWGMVAFMKQLPATSPVEYARMAESLGGGAADGAPSSGHSHAPGTPAHAH